MLSDLSILALLKLAQYQQTRVRQDRLGMSDLRSEHLDPLVSGGWITRHPGMKKSDRAANAPRHTGAMYEITEAGRDLIQRFVEITRAELAHQANYSHLAAASVI